MTTAIVLGGGIGGLLSARVLSDRFDQVHVIERGRYPDEPAARKHVPQGTQVHILLAEGYRLLQGWFPDFGARMDALGITEVDFGTDSVQFLGNASMPREHAGIAMRCATRPLLEWTVLQAVSAIPNVTIHQETEAQGWILEGGVVKGLRLQGPAGESTLAGDLVVDSSGRTGTTPKWLEGDGFGPVAETTVDAGFRYATGRFRLARPEVLKGATLLVCNAQAPDWPLLGVYIKLPDGTMHVCQIGPRELEPSVDTAAFIEGSRRMGSPMFHDALVGAEVVEELKPYRNTANRWRHYERMDRWPGRFVVLGDAVCTLNPRFGQGMTVAAMGAEALGKWIDDRGLGRLDADPVAFARGFQKRLSRAMTVAWLIATSDDMNFMPEVKLGLKDRIAGWYFKHLMALACRDGRVYVQFLRVAQLLDGPQYLFTPSLVGQVLRRAVRGDPAPAQVTAAPAT